MDSRRLLSGTSVHFFSFIFELKMSELKQFDGRVERENIQWTEWRPARLPSTSYFGCLHHFPQFDQQQPHNETNMSAMCSSLPIEIPTGAHWLISMFALRHRKTDDFREIVKIANRLFHSSLSFSLCLSVSLNAATQQGTREGGVDMDFRCVGRESAVRWIRGHSEGWTSPVQIGQQIDSGFGEEDPRAWHQFPADGECATLPGGHQEVRCARGGDFPNGRSIRTTQYSTSHIVFVFAGQNCK